MRRSTSGVSSPESAITSATSMPSSPADPARAARSAGVFESGSVRVFSPMYQAGGSNPKSRGDLVDGVFRGTVRGFAEHRRDDVPARPHDAAHLDQRLLRCIDVRDGEAAHRSVEAAIGERKRTHVADHGRHRRVADEAQHVARRVHGDGDCTSGPQRAGQRSGSGADIDHPCATQLSPQPGRSPSMRAGRTSPPGREPMRPPRPGRRCPNRRSGIPCSETLAPPAELGRVSGLGPAQLQEGPGQCRVRAAGPTTPMSRRRADSSADRYASMVSSLASGSRSQLTARYQARSTSGGASPGRSQSSRMVRAPSRPRLPSFQSLWTNVCGPACKCGDQRPRVGREGAEPARVRRDTARRVAAIRPQPREGPGHREASPPRARPSSGSAST